MSQELTQPHNLAPLPPNLPALDAELSAVLLKARVALAELKGACGQIPNPLLLTAPLVIRESIASSNIENINSSLEDVLQGQLFPEAERRAPDKEVLRYREALFLGLRQMREYALSSRTILAIQEELTAGIHGGYRRVQNKIVNSATGETIYLPPPANEVPGLIANWERYANDATASVDPLIRAAVCHYQFESIHPFGDGNGRTGRILMVLQLVQNGILDMPVLFISGYINQNRPEYYRLLRTVGTDDGAWREYLLFMLRGFARQAESTNANITRIAELFRETKAKLRTEHAKIYDADLVEAMFSYPVLTPTKLATELGIHYTTASRYLRQLAEAGIMQEAKVGKNHFFANKKLMEVLGE